MRLAAYTTDMKTLACCALLLVLSSDVQAADFSITVSSDDSRTEIGPRRDTRDARVAIRTRDRSTMLLLMDDVIAVQLTDETLAKMEDQPDREDEPGFLEELILVGVKHALGKSVEYPLANIRSVDYRNGELVIVNDRNQSVFDGMEIEEREVMKDFTRADAMRFANAFRARRTR